MPSSTINKNKGLTYNIHTGTHRMTYKLHILGQTAFHTTSIPKIKQYGPQDPYPGSNRMAYNIQGQTGWHTRSISRVKQDVIQHPYPRSNRITYTIHTKDQTGWHTTSISRDKQDGIQDPYPGSSRMSYNTHIQDQIHMDPNSYSVFYLFGFA